MGVRWQDGAANLMDLSWGIGSRLWLQYTFCPLCDGLVVRLAEWKGANADGVRFGDERMIYPPDIGVEPLPPEIEGAYASDFMEAARVLPISAKASAALSRRLVQRVLREKAGVTKRTLMAEIDAVAATGELPSALAEDLHAVRNVGNFAAHPMKDTETGIVLDVEPGEAEWLLGLLRDLLDFYFVTPARRAARMAALDAKLQQAGKRPPPRE